MGVGESYKALFGGEAYHLSVLPYGFCVEKTTATKELNSITNKVIEMHVTSAIACEKDKEVSIESINLSLKETPLSKDRFSIDEWLILREQLKSVSKIFARGVVKFGVCKSDVFVICFEQKGKTIGFISERLFYGQFSAIQLVNDIPGDS